MADNNFKSHDRGFYGCLRVLSCFGKMTEMSQRIKKQDYDVI